MECWNVDSPLLGLCSEDEKPGTAATTEAEPRATLQPAKEMQILEREASDIIQAHDKSLAILSHFPGDFDTKSL